MSLSFQVFQLRHLQSRLLPVISRIITPLMGCYCPSYPINRCFVLFCRVTTPFVTIGFSWPTVESVTLRLFIKCSALIGFRGSIHHTLGGLRYVVNVSNLGLLSLTQKTSGFCRHP